MAGHPRPQPGRQPRGAGADGDGRRPSCSRRSTSSPTSCRRSSAGSASSTSPATATSARCGTRASAPSSTATTTSATCSSTPAAPASTTGRSPASTRACATSPTSCATRCRPRCAGPRRTRSSPATGPASPTAGVALDDATRPRAVPAVLDLLVDLGDDHRGHGLEVAAGRGRPPGDRADHPGHHRPRRARPARRAPRRRRDRGAPDLVLGRSATDPGPDPGSGVPSDPCQWRDPQTGRCCSADVASGSRRSASPCCAPCPNGRTAPPTTSTTRSGPRSARSPARRSTTPSASLTDNGLAAAHPAGRVAGPLRGPRRRQPPPPHLPRRAAGWSTSTAPSATTPCLTAADDAGYEIDEAEVIYWGRCPECLASAT